MEAMAAFGLAANIVQFLNFGRILISDSRQIYHSLDGTTEEFESLEELCQYVGGLSAGLVPPESPDVLNALPLGLRPIQAEIDLARLALRCKEASDDLYNALMGFRLDGASRSKTASLRQCLKILMGKSRIRGLEKTVKSCREDLMFCLVAVTNERQSSVLRHLEELQEAKLTLVHDHSAKLNQIADFVHDIHSQAAKVLKTEDSARTEDANTVLLESLSSQLGNVVTVSSKRQWIAEHSLVASLYYESLCVRHEAIPEAHAETFKWLISRDVKKRHGAPPYPKSTILDWLQTGEGMYWISGKPGSGKSTLMKFIADHPQTQVALNEWTRSVSSGSECITATYYFWSAGTRLQKSVEGLLRSVLFDIFVRNPEFMPIVVSERWASVSTPNARRPSHQYHVVDGQVLHSWTTSEMSTALHRLSSHPAITQRFCIFIDGLDEYHGDHRELVKVVKGLSRGRNFKLCVSSRPLNVFEDSLGVDAAKKLYLHELTQHDIQRYTSSTLQEDPNWKASALTDARYNKLTGEITTKSQGVFLWVVLVVRSVLEGLSNGDSIHMLERRIKEIPRDLGPFFKHILHSVSPIYHRQTALYFRVALDAPQALTLMHFWFLDQCVESDQSALDASICPTDDHDIFYRHVIMRRRLNACCKGLLESQLNPPERRTYLSQRVAFLHRTVRDFLQTDEMAQFLDGLLDGYPVNIVMLMAHVAFIKSVPPTDRMRSLLEEALVYAGMAERESPELAIACVDELHRTAVDLGFLAAGSTQMARLAVQSGLHGYVSEGIKSRLAGFEDVSVLLGIALETSTSAAFPERVDILGMIRFLLDAGARLSDEKWAGYLRGVSAAVKGGRSEPEAAARHRDILGLLLPLVENVDAVSPAGDVGTHPGVRSWPGASLPGGVAWVDLFIEIVSDDWDSAPRNVAGTRVEMVQALFRHGADPNAPYGDNTVWGWFSTHVRRTDLERARKFSRGGGPRPEALAKLTEVLVDAGADVGHELSLTVEEVGRMFPPRLASRIAGYMRRQARLQGARDGVAQAPTTWAGWLFSWVWKGKS